MIDMNLINELRECNKENKIEYITAYIADDIRNKSYSQEQVMDLITIFKSYDLLSMKYETREQVLYTIGEIMSVYKIEDDDMILNLIIIIDDLEEDLKEYVDDIISFYHN